MVEVRAEVRPAWPIRLPRGGMDGVARRRGGVLERIVHLDGERVLLRAAQPAEDQVVLGAWGPDRDSAEHGLERLRFWTAVDDDLRDFYERFRFDPLIGRSVRTAPYLRPPRRAVPFEALAWAVCEQLIEYERAAAIQRRLVRRYGLRCPDTGLRDAPAAAVLAAAAPAELQRFDLSAARSVALIKAAREVASGRADLDAEDRDRAWRRLRAISGIGPWTLSILALHGQGEYDALPAGDLAYIKLVGQVQSGGDPYARADEADVAAFFERYRPWRGLAGAHALNTGAAELTAAVAEAA
jgi:3-methyladenine DNA glycosylase/8-oxoguanine DNA glycosylase